MRFTHVADVHDVLRSKGVRCSLFFLGKKTVKIDKGRKDKNDLIASKKLDQPLKHTIERYREVFDKLGFPAPMVFNNLFDFVGKDLSLLNTIVTEKEGTWIGIAPFAKHKGKIYPLEKMEKVVEKLSAQPNTTIFLFGAGKEEQKVLSLWAKKYPNIIDPTGKVNLNKELLLMSYMDVMLTMDSANMHLASLVQVPVVSIWGATHPDLGFYGFRQDLKNAIQIDDLDCRPCSVFGEQPCLRGDYACLNRINEETVVDRINKVIAAKQK